LRGQSSKTRHRCLWSASSGRGEVTCGEDVWLNGEEEPNVEGWSNTSYKWLNKVEVDAALRLLPQGTTAWDALESNFREAFVDYAESEKALEKMK